MTAPREMGHDGTASAPITDAETVLRAARRPLVLGIGGGGDVVGALASAELCRVYDRAEPILGGLTWERRPIDPEPGPRAVGEITGGEELAPGVLLASGGTHVAGRDVVFAESRMAAFLGQKTVLIDPNGGPGAVAAGLGLAAEKLQRDLLLFVDVGGDVLARGDEPGLRSPLCDAIMLAAGARLIAAGWMVLVGLFGAGCDAELTPDEVLARLAAVAAAGGLCGARGLTGPVADRLEQAIALVPTEASAQAVRAFRGGSGPTPIRGGASSVELSTLASVTFYLDLPITITASAPLAQAVAPATSLEAANDALHELGVRTELDLERAAAAS